MPISIAGEGTSPRTLIFGMPKHLHYAYYYPRGFSRLKPYRIFGWDKSDLRSPFSNPLFGENAHKIFRWAGDITYEELKKWETETNFIPKDRIWGELIYQGIKYHEENGLDYMIGKRHITEKLFINDKRLKN